MAPGRKSIVFAGILILNALIICGSPAPAAGMDERDVRLFVEKCGRCHKWQRPIKHFAGESNDERKKEILKMQSKKPGWISDADLVAITELLTENDLAAIAEEAGKAGGGKDAGSGKGEGRGLEHRSHWEDDGGEDKESPEAERLITGIQYVHGAGNGLNFLLLGIFMAVSGLVRWMERKRESPEAGKFDWKKHVGRGKLYVAFVFLGLGAGFAIFALDGFHAGNALGHLLAGCAVAVLYSGGGAIGLKLAKGEAAKLKTAHMALNLAATALFIFNIITGVILLLGD